MEKVERKAPRYPALDVLRILAFIGIIVYHYYPQHLPGGFIGVDLFFVLSGFLFAHHYYARLHAGRPEPYLAGTLRRAARLWLPLAFTAIVSLAIIAPIAPAFLFNVRAQLLSGLTFTNNWWQIAQGSSYFAEFVNPSAYTHFWYVAVQMQLYVLMPVLLYLGYRCLGSRERVALGLLILAAASALAMALLYHKGGDPSRVYYGTDTRAFAFLIGGAAGVMRRPVDGRGGGRESYVADLMALLGLAGLFLMADTLIDQKAFTYRGGLVIVAFLTTIAILGLCSGRLANRFLDFAPIRIAGEHTYALYLWYYPVYAVSGRLPWIREHAIVQWLILLLFGILTHGLIERRLLRLHADRLPALTEGLRDALWRRSPAAILALVLVALIALSSGIALATAPAGKNQTVAEMEAQLAANQRKLAEKKAREAEEKARQAEAAGTLDPASHPGLEAPIALAMSEKPISMIGDSILLSAVDALTNVFPKSHIDGLVGRQLYASGDAIHAMEARGEMADTLVIVLGSNGTFTQEQIEDLLDPLADRTIYLVNTHVDRPWRADANARLADYAKAHKNTHLIDWDKAATGHDEWFWGDGTHCNPEGAVAFTNLLAHHIYDVDQSAKQPPKKNKKATTSAQKSTKNDQRATKKKQ